ncbi:ATP-binding protein [Rhodococcus sp. 14-2470-1a]|uniref:ATP-binding protein n=1 Tax=Rhodococcus sp. 14-2470-1a TaxID=2023150 RepID=UPI000B9BB96E|nr:ATP-binding protein [Rhodococcus sp. 14-2470-1a]OZF42596.1 ATPase [Rhodococcus sp. 14-2470-1a]
MAVSTSELEGSPIFDDELVQLATLAMAGAQPGVQGLVRRVAKRARKAHPDLAQALIDVLRTSPTRSADGAASTAATPVDLDTRIPLLRREFPVILDESPVLERDVSDKLEQIVAEHLQLDSLSVAGLYPTRTALLVGPPGVGKTMSARWIASLLNLPLLTLDLSAVMSSFLGRTGGNLSRVLGFAKTGPGVLLLDELDAVAKRRDDTSEIGELKRLVTVLLQEIDLWPKGSLLLAATNHPELLDPAIWRRFEVTVNYPLPGVKEIRAMIDGKLADEALPTDLLDGLARLFVGSSLSDVERELLRSRRNAVVHGVPLTDAVLSGTRERFRGLAAQERRAIATDLMQTNLFSQRQIHDLSGVSRDTLRRHSSKSPSAEER